MSTGCQPDVNRTATENRIAQIRKEKKRREKTRSDQKRVAPKGETVPICFCT
jgi:hypothetical protein